MKRIVIAVGLVLLFGPTVLASEQSLLARVTVYWASGGGGSDRWSRQHICSTGARLRAGHCAVDPRRIPYGSKVTLPDGPLLAVDTGSAVVSRKAARRSGRSALERSAIVIDRFFETKQQALSWANRNPYFMLVRVSPPGFRTLPIPAPAESPASNSPRCQATSNSASAESHASSSARHAGPAKVATVHALAHFRPRKSRSLFVSIPWP